MSRPLLVLSCSATKFPVAPSDRVPFTSLYDGPMWRQVRSSGFALDRVAAVSALYGFLGPGDKVYNYDREIDEKISRRICHESDHVSRFAKLVGDAGDVLLIGGALYQELGHTAERWRPELAGRITYGQGSFLRQRKQLGVWLRAHQASWSPPLLVA